jgi:hypothetical protein
MTPLADRRDIPVPSASGRKVYALLASSVPNAIGGNFEGDTYDAP